MDIPGKRKIDPGPVWRWGSLALLGVLLVLSLYTLWYFVSHYRRLPSPSDLYRAEQIIRSRAQPGDRLMANPTWAYYDLLTGMRHDRGGRFEWIEGVEDGKLDCELETDVSRLWVISLFGERLPWAFQQLGFRPYMTQDIGRLRVTGLQRAVPLQTMNLRKDFPSAKVWAETRNGFKADAELQGDQFVFAGQPPWTSIHDSIENVGGEIHRCIFTHPQSDRLVKIRFQPPAWARRFHIDAGLTLSAMWQPDPGEVMLRVLSDNREIGRMRFRSVSRFDHEMLDLRKPSSPLTIEVSATDVGGRHFCWRGFFLGKP